MSYELDESNESVEVVESIKEELGQSVHMIRLASGVLIDPLTREPIQSAFKNAPRNRNDDNEYEDESTSSNRNGSNDSDDNDNGGDGDAADDLELNIIPVARRSIMDLTLNAQQMAVVNNVLVYSLWGLPDNDIATQCNCSEYDVTVIRNLDEYSRMREALISGLHAGLRKDVASIFALAAPKAAKGVVKEMKSKSAEVRLSAQKDVLDRAGFRPADKVEHTHKISDDLVIRIIKSSDTEAIPTLDLKPNA